MIFGQDRRDLRQMYSQAWRKARASEPLTPLEAQIAEVIAEHPEYQDALSDEALETDYSAADSSANPFLHMALHLALRDQVATDRPKGISMLFQQLAAQISNPHEAEHRMLECLRESLVAASNRNVLPDEQEYLARLKQLLG